MRGRCWAEEAAAYADMPCDHNLGYNYMLGRLLRENDAANEG